MQEKKEFRLGIVLLAIGILLIALPITFLQGFKLQIIYRIPLLLRFLRGSPFLGITICFLSWGQLGKYQNVSRKWLYFGEVYIFALGFLLGMGLVEYSWSIFFILFQFLFYAIVPSTSSFVKIGKKTLLSVLTASSLFSIVSSYFAYPFYESSRAEAELVLIFMPDLRVSFFYVLVFATTIVTLLFAYSLMTYLDILMHEFLRRPATSISAAKSIAVHLQLIPVVLSPLAILQTFGKTEFLEPTVFVLFVLCYGRFVTVILCPIVAIIGRNIGSMKFLGVASLWSLISFIQNASVVFDFIVLNMDAGSYAFTLIVSSLFASVLGIASSRIS